MSNLIAWDTETFRIEPGVAAPRIVIGSTCDSSRKPELHKYQDGFITNVAIGGRCTHTIAGANIAYDFCCLLGEHPELLPEVWSLYEQGRVFDVLIAATLNAIGEGRIHEGEDGKNHLFYRNGAQAFDPASRSARDRYSLSMCVYECFGRLDAKENDTWKLRYGELADVPLQDWPEEARQYPLDDALNTYDVAVYQQDPKNGFMNLHDQSKQAHTAFCLQLATVYGIRADPVRSEKFITENEAAVHAMQGALIEAGLLKPKYKGRGSNKTIVGYSRDTAAVRARVSAAMGVMTPTTDKGDVSTERTVLNDSGDPVLATMAQYGAGTSRTRYYEALRTASQVPLNVPANVLLVTGRTSYSGVIQTFPQKGGIRECFVPRPGYVYCSVDYSGIELSALAQVCLWTVGHSKLAEVLNSGKDAHSVFGSEMGGYGYDEFLRNKKKDPFSGLRQGAKAANFGYPGGMGEVTFVVQKRRAGMILCQLLNPSKVCGKRKLREYRGKPLDFPVCADCVQESLKLRQGFFRNWPEVGEYLNWVKDHLLLNNKSITQFVSKRIRGSCKFTAGANTLFQGLAADGFKEAIRELTRRMYLVPSSALFGCRAIMYTHDDGLLEMPEDRAPEAAEEQSKVMVECMQRYIPDVLVQAPPTLMRCLSKEAEEVRDANGRLMVWEAK